jgi:hypothetical protein
MSFSDMTRGKNAYLIFLPLFIAAVIVGVYIVNYLFDPALSGLTANISKSATTIALFTQLLAIVTMLIMAVGEVQRSKDYTDKRFYSNAIILVTFVAFILLALANYPALHKGDSFELLYLYTAGYLSSSRSFNMWIAFAVMLIRYMRITSIESFAYLAALVMYTMREFTVLPAIWAPFAAIGTWTENTLGTPAWRTLVMVAAVGAVLIAFRTLIMKERGILEEEAS